MESRLWNQDSRLWNQDSRTGIKIQDSRTVIKNWNQDSIIKILESRFKTAQFEIGSQSPLFALIRERVAYVARSDT